MGYMAKLLGFLALCLLLTSVYADQTTPVGSWKTIDDITGKAKGILKIWKEADGTLQGRLVKIFPDPGHDEHELCTACEGERHNQPIQGMLIMWGLKHTTDKWVDGRILDPKTGNVYKVNMKVLPDSNKMQVHGYIGVPLFGRTQTW